MLLPDGRRIELNQLPDGWSSVLAIASELMIREITQPGEGLVLIDEIDAHLHVELQRKVLGILTELFPKLQFIVTTHSPAVLTSAQNTRIFDLDDDESYSVDELRGKSYGVLLRAPFGLSDVDIDTEQKWEQWNTFHKKQGRTALEQEEYQKLTRILSDRSAVYQLRIWHIQNMGEEPLEAS